MNTLNIITFEEKYLEEMARLFVEVYSEPGTERMWNIETAKAYLKRNTDHYPEYCLVALDQEHCIGGIFCRVDPYYSGKFLFVDSVQVQPEYRQKGISKMLLQHVLRIAKENNLNGVHLLADAREGFPKSWYQGIGFELSGWAEYEANWKRLEGFMKEE